MLYGKSIVLVLFSRGYYKTLDVAVLNVEISPSMRDFVNQEPWTWAYINHGMAKSKVYLQNF